MIIIIEGIDRLGKDTLIKGICEYLKNDYDEIKVFHSGKPDYPEQQYSYFCNSAINAVLRSKNTNDLIIFNRFHLGECVYGPLYRHMKSDWVIPCVETRPFIEETKLILLTMNNLELRTDDGQSYNHKNALIEQNMFKAAFHKSLLHKAEIEVDCCKAFRYPNAILADALTFLKSDTKMFVTNKFLKVFPTKQLINNTIF